MLKPKTAILIAAAAGGTVPNVVRIALSLIQAEVQWPTPSRAVTYSLGLLLMAAAGSFMAWIFEPKNRKKAFYFGMGLPAMLQLTVAHVTTPNPAVTPAPTEQPAAPKAPMQIHGLGISGQPGFLVKPRHVELRVKNPQKDTEVIFLSTDGKERHTVPVVSDTTTIPVPAFADSCVVRYRGAVSKPAKIPQEPVTKLEATIEENRWGGFLNAVGNSTSYYQVRWTH